MGMRGYNTIEPFRPINHPHRHHRTMPAKQIDITVYRRKGYTGNPRLDFLVHPLSAWMGCGGLDNLQNGVPLLTGFLSNLVHHYKHLPESPELIMIIIIDINILNITEIGKGLVKKNLIFENYPKRLVIL
jgi:hypothetical protein